MIESLSIQNFKVLREVDMNLQPLTVIVGPNASGKTSILQAIALLSAWLGGDRNAHFLGQPLNPYQLSRRGSTGATTISCRAKIGELEGSFTCNLTLQDVKNTGSWLKWNYNLLSLDLRKLSAPSYPQDTTLTLPSDGQGLSSVLAGLRLEYPQRFVKIVDQLKTVISHLVDVRIRRIQVEQGKIGNELLFDLQGAEAIPAHAVSEGTLLALGVLTALSISESPQVALIDDIERGLHPRAMKDYLTQLRSLQKQDPQLQIIATSHSPYLLDYLQADEVLLTSLD